MDSQPTKLRISVGKSSLGSLSSKVMDEILTSEDPICKHHLCQPIFYLSYFSYLRPGNFCTSTESAYVSMAAASENQGQGVRNSGIKILHRSLKCGSTSI